MLDIFFISSMFDSHHVKLLKCVNFPNRNRNLLYFIKESFLVPDLPTYPCICYRMDPSVIMDQTGYGT